MSAGVRLSLTAGFACLIGACASQPPPATQAVATEQLQCSARPAAEDQQAITSMESQLIRSEPLYSLVATKDVQPEARVNGAKIVVQLPPDITPERMTRVLQCHSARATLGRADEPTFRDDPFVLRGSWLNIDVKDNKQGAYAVTIAANDIHEGLEVLQNANNFVASRGGKVDNTCLPWPTENPAQTCVEPASHVPSQLQ